MAEINPQQACIISIEGNIGSGKSTLMAELRQAYVNSPHVVFLQEPVDEWNTVRDEEGRTMLEKFYANQTKYSFSFQMMAYISRLAVIRNAIRTNPRCVFISERCLHTDKYVFAKMLYDDHKIESVDYQIYNKWFDTFIEDFSVTNIVYLKADAELCMERIKSRGRDGENAIPLAYLQACGEYHDSMMKKMDCDIHVLNGNVNIHTNPDHLANWLFQINVFVDKLTRTLQSTRTSTPDSGADTPKTKVE
jgi:deoxyadenosine/deoxycytidine kinase